MGDLQLDQALARLQERLDRGLAADTPCEDADLRAVMDAARSTLRTHGGRVLISDAREMAKRRDQQATVILGVERDGTVTIVTYGETKAKCDSIGEWAAGLWKHGVTAVPFQTMFGWGKAGVPTPLTSAELASLSDAGRAYAARHTPIEALPKESA